jgi:glycosyltransferase involved in cell wall biosynthesis
VAPDVALISPYPPPDGSVRSGVEWAVRGLANALGDAGLGVTVIAQQAPGAPAVSRDGPVLVERRFRRGRRALDDAVGAALRTGADVVHVQHELFLFGGPASVPPLPIALRRLGRAGRGPVVTMHQVVAPGTVDAEFTRMHRVRVPAPLARVALAGVQGAVGRLAAAVVVHERSFVDTLPGSRAIPLGTDPAPGLDRSAARRRLGLDAERLVALCFGFVAPYKGIEPVAEAARLAGGEVEVVVAGGPHPRLAGRDDYAGALMARHATHVRFTGFVPDADVAAWFAAADVVLVPHPRPFSSSGPVTLAVAHGRPLLLSEAMARCVGAPAQLVMPADPLRLAHRLLGLARDRRSRDDLLAASVRLAEGRSWPAVAQAHVELYEEVSRAGRARRAARVAG